MNLIALLSRESVDYAQNPSPVYNERIEKIRTINDRLSYEIRWIDSYSNMEGKIRMTRDAFAKWNKNKMEMMSSWPDFVIETSQEYLQK